MLYIAKLLLVSTVILVSACTANRNDSADNATIRICDDNGCADRPKNYASYDPKSALPPEDEAKIAALEQLASNDPRAAYDLALRYFRGDGVRQNTHKSITWMRDAAERGDLNAQKALGRLYLTGLGELGADPGEAEKWLSITSSRGDKEAEKLLGEAIAARQSEQADYQWRRRWQPIFYNYWYSTCSYYWRWGSGRWYLYY